MIWVLGHGEREGRVIRGKVGGTERVGGPVAYLEFLWMTRRSLVKQGGASGVGDQDTVMRQGGLIFSRVGKN